jgi:hypothetical protein
MIICQEERWNDAPEKGIISKGAMEKYEGSLCEDISETISGKAQRWRKVLAVFSVKSSGPGWAVNGPTVKRTGFAFLIHSNRDLCVNAFVSAADLRSRPEAASEESRIFVQMQNRESDPARALNWKHDFCRQRPFNQQKESIIGKLESRALSLQNRSAKVCHNGRSEFEHEAESNGRNSITVY